MRATTSSSTALPPRASSAITTCSTGAPRPPTSDVWNNADQNQLADWQAASGQDANSLDSQPQFVDINGADNVLGFAQAGGVFVDGGADDNFYLRADSPGIDRAYSWSYATDADGFTRRDAPGTANQGSADYFPTTLGSSLFSATGTRLSLFSSTIGVTLPFSFPFYDGSYTILSVSTLGYIHLGNDSSLLTQNNRLDLIGNRRIAPLWDSNLLVNTIADPGDGIYVDTSVAGQVTIRWNATNMADGSDVNFDVVLFSDGRIRFDYGPGNTNLHSTVGISSGFGRAYQLPAGYDGAASLTNAPSVEFDLAPGVTDMGAYEFRGSSFDVTPPTIVGTHPTAIDASGDTGGKINAIEVNFSEDVNPIDAGAAAVYELRRAGSQGFGSADDVVYSPHATLRPRLGHSHA